MIHWVWSNDSEESLCGLNMKNTKWEDDSNPISCPDCIEIDMIASLTENNLEVAHD